MKKTIIILLCFQSLFLVGFAQDELYIDYKDIKEQVEDSKSETYYPKLLKRYNNFDTSLSLDEYALIYYGFSFQRDYLKNQPKEDELSVLFNAKKYDELITKCQIILEKNPVSLSANNYMGYALYELGKSENEWRRYQNRYRMIRKVIALSGNGVTSETAFKVIYISDEYNMMYDYFEIEEIYSQTLEGLCDRFEVTSSEYYLSNTIYFDISRKLIRQQEIVEGK